MISLQGMAEEGFFIQPSDPLSWAFATFSRFAMWVLPSSLGGSVLAIIWTLCCKLWQGISYSCVCRILWVGFFGCRNIEELAWLPFQKYVGSLLIRSIIFFFTFLPLQFGFWMAPLKCHFCSSLNQI